MFPMGFCKYVWEPWVSNYPLAALLGKMAQVFAHKSEGCEFESHPGPKLTGLRDFKII